MRRDGEFFGDQEMELIFIAKTLREALRAEDVLTGAGIDYAVEPDRYLGGVLFKRELTGAFFYVVPEGAEAAKGVLRGAKFKVAELG